MADEITAEFADTLSGLWMDGFISGVSSSLKTFTDATDEECDEQALRMMEALVSDRVGAEMMVEAIRSRVVGQPHEDTWKFSVGREE